MTEEKVLIRSTKNEQAYRNSLTFIYSLAAGSALLFALMFSLAMGWESFSMAFWGWFAVANLFAVVFHFIFKKTYDRVNIVVTDRKITGTYGFCSQINIPIDFIRLATVDTSIFRAIDITCTSDVYRITFVENGKEIIDVINKLIAERRISKTPHSTPVVTEQKASLDLSIELRKYKSLLDDGLITQEEYDAKKKQLLGL